MIAFEHVDKRYGKDKVAVSDLNLQVASGRIFGFLGPNGAGKSTTIRMLVGILAQDAGRVLVDDLDVDGDALAVKKRIGYVPDEPMFYQKMTGMRHLQFICDIFGVEDRTEKISRLARTFMMTDALSDEIAGYSHGMKQKLGVIAALVHEPRLLVLDEPMVGLDPKASYLLKQTMRRFADEGNTVFFSTHVLEVAQEICDEVGIIDHGRLLYQGTFRDLQGQGNETLEQLFLQMTERPDET